MESLLKIVMGYAILKVLFKSLCYACLLFVLSLLIGVNFVSIRNVVVVYILVFFISKLLKLRK